MIRHKIPIQTQIKGMNTKQHLFQIFRMKIGPSPFWAVFFPPWPKPWPFRKRMSPCTTNGNSSITIATARPFHVLKGHFHVHKANNTPFQDLLKSSANRKRPRLDPMDTFHNMTTHKQTLFSRTSLLFEGAVKRLIFNHSRVGQIAEPTLAMVHVIGH